MQPGWQVSQVRFFSVMGFLAPCTLRAQVEYLLNTGNLGTGSGSGIDLSQASGFTIVAEKLNFFRRAAQRGAARAHTHSLQLASMPTS